MPTLIYGTGLSEFMKGGNWGTDTIRCALVTSSYTPDQDLHDFFNDVTNEASGTGYTAGGQTLASKTQVYDSATNVIRFDAADAVWTGATITARGAVIYKSTGTNSTSPLIAYIDFGADVTATAGPFTVQFNASGVFKVTAV